MIVEVPYLGFFPDREKSHEVKISTFRVFTMTVPILRSYLSLNCKLDNLISTIFQARLQLLLKGIVKDTAVRLALYLSNLKPC